MSFESVWGFDPYDVLRAQELGRREPNSEESGDDSADQAPPGMPLDVDAQICELHRMVGL
jgi:hypothetical protein